jgi:hypothetical protein
MGGIGLASIIGNLIALYFYLKIIPYATALAKQISERSW